MQTLRSTLLVLAIVVAGAAQQSFTQQMFAQSKNGMVNPVSSNDLLSWNERYQAAHPDLPFGNFYGKRMIDEMLTMRNATGVFVFNALDINGTVRIVFKMASHGQVMANNTAYDASYPCPPMCPKEGDNLKDIGAQIAEAKAQEMIENFQLTYPHHTKAVHFEKQDLEKVLAQKNAAGIYFGNAINDHGQETMVLAGIEANGNIMWDGVTVNTGTPASPVGYPSRAVALNK